MKDTIFYTIEDIANAFRSHGFSVSIISRNSAKAKSLIRRMVGADVLWGPTSGQQPMVTDLSTSTVYLFAENVRPTPLSVIYHELGHVVYYRLSDDLAEEYWRRAKSSRFLPSATIVTRYPEERFAEEFSLMFFHPGDVKRANKQTYEFLLPLTKKPVFMKKS